MDISQNIDNIRLFEARAMKKWIALGILAVLVIGMVLMSGCTNAGSTSSVPVATPTPQIVYVTVLVTPTPTPTPRRIAGQDPIIGVWRCSDSSGYDDRIRFNSDHTWVESFDWFGSGKTDVSTGTWRAQGGNSYVTVDTEFKMDETIIYSPSRNAIYYKETPTFLLTPYQGDVKAASNPTKK